MELKQLIIRNNKNETIEEKDLYHISWDWNAEDMFPGITDEEFGARMEELRKSGTPIIQPKDLSYLKDKSQYKQIAAAGGWMGLGAIGLAAMAILIIIIIGIWYCCHKKEQEHAEPLGDALGLTGITSAHITNNTLSTQTPVITKTIYTPNFNLLIPVNNPQTPQTFLLNKRRSLRTRIL